MSPRMSYLLGVVTGFACGQIGFWIGRLSA